MSRWLITGTMEGGGLDMFIPSTDFSVSSESSQPNEDNIVYDNNTGNKRLIDVYKKQNDIFERYEQVLQEIATCDKNDKKYAVLEEAIQKQKDAYEALHKSLTEKRDYVSQFTQIVNITHGLGNQLSEKEEDRADNIADLIVNELNWEYLYTSGHWNNVISSWLDIHTQVLTNSVRFTADFQKITSKINSSALYRELAGDVAKVLAQKGDDDYISAIAPIVMTSGKVTAYKGPLASYIKGTVGSVAPDLVLTIVSSKKNRQGTISMKISGEDFKNTLLIFYKSEDTNSMEILKQLSAKYNMIKASGVRIIALSADSDEKTFQSKAKDFPWEDTYCDYKGAEGDNFKNYSVTGVPTVVLTGAEGKIISRGASLSF